MLSFAFKDSIILMKILSHLRVDLLFSLRKEKSKQKRNEPFICLIFNGTLRQCKRKEKSKQKRNEPFICLFLDGSSVYLPIVSEKSENPSVIFFLYRANAYDSDTKKGDQNGNRDNGNLLGVAQKAD